MTQLKETTSHSFKKYADLLDRYQTAAINSASTIKRGTRILEFGVGDGDFAAYHLLASADPIFTGLENDIELMRTAEERIKGKEYENDGKISLYKGTMLSHTINETFDRIYAMNQVELLSDVSQEHVIHKMHKLLNPGGDFIMGAVVKLDGIRQDRFALAEELDLVHRLKIKEQQEKLYKRAQRQRVAWYAKRFEKAGFTNFRVPFQGLLHTVIAGTKK